MEIVKKFFVRKNKGSENLKKLRESVFEGLEDLENLLSQEVKIDRRLKSRRSSIYGRRKTDNQLL